MRRTALDTRRRIVSSAYRLFYREGFLRSGMDWVAAEAGVTKRTLYNHFPSRDALIAAVIEEQAELAQVEIRRWCADHTATPEALISGIFAGLRQWSGTPGWHGSGFTRAAMELAWAPGHPARAAAAAQKRSVERYLAQALAQVGGPEPDCLARQLALLIEGATALRLIHGDEAWFHTAEAAALDLVRARSLGRPDA